MPVLMAEALIVGLFTIAAGLGLYALVHALGLGGDE